MMAKSCQRGQKALSHSLYLLSKIVPNNFLRLWSYRFDWSTPWCTVPSKSRMTWCTASTSTSNCKASFLFWKRIMFQFIYRGLPMTTFSTIWGWLNLAISKSSRPRSSRTMIVGFWSSNKENINSWKNRRRTEAIMHSHNKPRANNSLKRLIELSPENHSRLTSMSSTNTQTSTSISFSCIWTPLWP